ncbi:Beta-glucosidase 5 [Rhynchospora pubera]|uniref:Beta-glucosidase 5 n=1 Tax=Rhynchospora pubera TaxID=906938 RepID=A0AAV8HLW4_9POAL|nr:Beta-glucosidase 5 [Rhynchospora pubera]
MMHGTWQHACSINADRCLSNAETPVSYCVEGAAHEEFRSDSIWDIFTHSGMMPDKSTADVAADGYYKYKEDVKLMADVGLEAYRFSISWSRLIFVETGEVNPKGVEYYNNLIDELLKHGIQVHVMLYQLDLPQRLEDKYQGWLSTKIIDDFTVYADVCFREFGDRVKYWTTMAEPNILSMASYDQGSWPPSHCSNPFGIINCTIGNSTIEPYIVMHNLLLAHASVYNLYRTRYYEVQKGIVGINVYTFGLRPFSDSASDKKAVHRFRDFFIGWNGVDVRGYFLWSFIDLFEFLGGYETTFGLFWVDFDSEEKTRRPKLSAHWYSNFIRNRSTNSMLAMPNEKYQAEQ